jgi:hypothetical protein
VRRHDGSYSAVAEFKHRHVHIKLSEQVSMSPALAVTVFRRRPNVGHECRIVKEHD